MTATTESVGASVYQRGARDGLVAGALMLAMFLCQALSLRLPVLTFVADVLMLAVPVAAFMMMRRGYIQPPAQRQFATVWMHGILIFICGSLLMAAGTYIYCRLINPEFLPDLLEMTGQMLEAMPDADAALLGEQMEQLVRQGLVPSPIQAAFSFLWLGSFSGSLLSMFLALIIPLTIKKKQ